MSYIDIFSYQVILFLNSVGYVIYCTYSWMFLLQVIQVSNKRFVYLDMKTFSGLMRLRFLRIMNCQLTQMPSLDPIKKSIILLNLTHNNISHIPGKYFEGFAHFKHLIIRSNYLTEIPNIQSLNCTLIEFDLGDNKITTLPDSFTDHVFKLLKHLDLWSNLLTQFDMQWLANLPALHTLDIARNPLTAVPNITGFMEGHSNHIEVRFGSEMIVCDSSVTWIFDGLQLNESIGISIKRGYIEIHGFLYSTCATPKRLSGRLLGLLSKEINYYPFTYLTLNVRGPSYLGLTRSIS